MGYSWKDLKEDVSSSVKNVANAGKKAVFDATGTTGTIAKKKKESDIKADNKSFAEFENQDFLDPNSELYKPMYLRSPEMKKEQEAMLSLFNSRKDQILSQRATPGIAQTRF